MLEIEWASGRLRMVNGRPHKLGLVEEYVDLPASADEESLAFRLVVDLTSLEIFINDGAASASFCYLPDAYKHSLVFYGAGAEQILSNLEFFELQSIFQ
jgi:sucrose-6-phosphate hydrolase SacC (GH32 family)